MLFEFDERFAVFKDDFTFYDFKQPLKLDREFVRITPGKGILKHDIASLKGAFDRIICDPPFLSEDCQSKGDHRSDMQVSRDSTDKTYHSRTYCPLAGKDMEPSQLLDAPGQRHRHLTTKARTQAHPMHRRAYGGLGAQIVWQGWRPHHDFLPGALQGSEQRVQMLRQL